MPPGRVASLDPYSRPPRLDPPAPRSYKDRTMPGQRDEIPISTLEAWGLSPGKRIWIGGHNANAHRQVESLIAIECERPPTGPLDLAIVTPHSTDEAVYFARKLRSRLDAGAAIWIVFPKFGTTQEREFTGNFDEMAIALYELGFKESARAPVGESYTSTGFTKSDALI